jgi:hypothetical protein
MNCPKCNSSNDPDALFCAGCGAAIAIIDKPSRSASASRKAYFYALLFIPIIALAAGFGYYKYFLPRGIAAVVNGVEISVAELDAAVARIQPSSLKEEAQREQTRRLRHDVLNQLITERLAFQEAQKDGVDVSDQDLAVALERIRQAGGLDKDAFKAVMIRDYGSTSGFEEAIRRGLVIDTFIAEKIIPHGTPLRDINALLEKWVERLHEKGSVRIALSEQWTGSGCGCCNNRAAAGTAQPKSSAAPGAGTSSRAPVDEATAAALRYWHERHGQEEVTAEARDFGCHFQVDILKASKKIGSLRYQQGSITEL